MKTALAATTPQPASLLCPCNAPLSTSALAMATGLCSDCQPELPPVVWDWIERGNHAAHVEANYYVHCIEGAPGAIANVNGGFVQRRYFRFGAELSFGAWEIGDIAEGTAPDGETIGGIEHDMHSRQRKYQGRVTAPGFAKATALVAQLEAEQPTWAEAKADAEERQAARDAAAEPIADTLGATGGAW